jgi:indolepyruvate ferredoxin oxidoreductase beta subunit
VLIDDMDALTLANEAGTAKAVNLVLMGRLSRYFPEISEEKWMTAIEECVKPKFVEINKKAFALGRA